MAAPAEASPAAPDHLAWGTIVVLSPTGAVTVREGDSALAKTILAHEGLSLYALVGSFTVGGAGAGSVTVDLHRTPARPARLLRLRPSPLTLEAASATGRLYSHDGPVAGLWAVVIPPEVAASGSSPTAPAGPGSTTPPATAGSSGPEASSPSAPAPATAPAAGRGVAIATGVLAAVLVGAAIVVRRVTRPLPYRGGHRRGSSR
jgi:hypothetical protein